MATGKRTFLAAQHERRGAKLIDFAGWQLPVQFEGVLAEHRHCRTACAVFDTCHMGQFHFSGRDAAITLAGLLSRDITSQPVGSSWYSLLLNEQAGILDDTILLRLAETEFLLIVNGATRQSDLQWIRSHVQGQVDIAEQADWGKLDVQGPASARVLADWVDFNIDELEYFHCRKALCLGHPCVIGRSGYTGELGYELFMPAPALSELYERLLAHELVKPAGLGARDLLRLEMGYPLYGHDIDATTDPLEADLMAFVAMGHDFIGRQRLMEIARQGPSRRRVAFVCNGRARPDPLSVILIKTQHTGTVTSGGFSPSLQAAIGMGYVALDAAAVGNALTIDTGKRTILATVSAKPLYHLGTCRTPYPWRRSSMVPDDLLYTPQHEWIRLEGDIATVGITDYAQHELGDLTFVDLPKPGATLKKGQSAVQMESAKAAADVYAPAGGEVTEVNTPLPTHPELVNSDCYGAGWMIRFRVADRAELADLLDPKSYGQLVG